MLILPIFSIDALFKSDSFIDLKISKRISQGRSLLTDRIFQNLLQDCHHQSLFVIYHDYFTRIENKSNSKMIAYKIYGHFLNRKW
jgi:hypothetical protein